jgi:hypothetical protein
VLQTIRYYSAANSDGPRNLPIEPIAQYGYGELEEVLIEPGFIIHQMAVWGSGFDRECEFSYPSLLHLE